MGRGWPCSQLGKRLVPLYVVASSAIADAIGFGDQSIASAIEKCRRAGVGGAVCEMLRSIAGQPYCGGCECPHKVKRAFGMLESCPMGRW